MILNASLISTYATLSFSDNLPENKWAKTGLLVLASAQVVDLFNHTRNSSPYSDSGKVIHYLKTHKGMSDDGAFWSVKAPQIVFTAIGAGALALEGYRIFTTKKIDQNSRYQLIPTASDTSFGLGIAGKF